MKCKCGRKMWFQPSLFDQGDGQYICVKCGRTNNKPAKQTKRTKVIDYAELQNRLFYYTDKKKQLQQQGSDVKELAWCEFVRKQKQKDLGLLGFTQEDYIAAK